MAEEKAEARPLGGESPSPASQDDTGRAPYSSMSPALKAALTDALNSEEETARAECPQLLQFARTCLQRPALLGNGDLRRPHLEELASGSFGTLATRVIAGMELAKLSHDVRTTNNRDGSIPREWADVMNSLIQERDRYAAAGGCDASLLGVVVAIRATFGVVRETFGPFDRLGDYLLMLELTRRCWQARHVEPDRAAAALLCAQELFPNLRGQQLARLVDEAGASERWRGLVNHFVHDVELEEVRHFVAEMRDAAALAAPLTDRLREAIDVCSKWGDQRLMEQVLIESARLLSCVGDEQGAKQSFEILGAVRGVPESTLDNLSDEISRAKQVWLRVEPLRRHAEVLSARGTESLAELERYAQRAFQSATTSDGFLRWFRRRRFAVAVPSGQWKPVSAYFSDDCLSMEFVPPQSSGRDWSVLVGVHSIPRPQLAKYQHYFEETLTRWLRIASTAPPQVLEMRAPPGRLRFAIAMVDDLALGSRLEAHEIASSGARAFIVKVALRGPGAEGRLSEAASILDDLEIRHFDAKDLQAPPVYDGSEHARYGLLFAAELQHWHTLNPRAAMFAGRKAFEAWDYLSLKIPYQAYVRRDVERPDGGLWAAMRPMPALRHEFELFFDEDPAISASVLERMADRPQLLGMNRERTDQFLVYVSAMRLYSESNAPWAVVRTLRKLAEVSPSVDPAQLPRGVLPAILRAHNSLVHERRAWAIAAISVLELLASPWPDLDVIQRNRGASKMFEQARAELAGQTENELRLLRARDELYSPLSSKLELRRFFLRNVRDILEGSALCRFVFAPQCRGIFLRPLSSSREYLLSAELAARVLSEARSIDLRSADPTRMTLEAVLSLALLPQPLTAVGGAVAVGDLTTSRVLTLDADWKTFVGSILDDIAALRTGNERSDHGFIVVIPSDSDGLMWELSAIVERKLLDQVFFVMPAEELGETTAEEWHRSARSLAKHLQWELPPFAPAGAVFQLDAKGKVRTYLSFSAIWRGDFADAVRDCLLRVCSEEHWMSWNSADLAQAP